MDNLRLILIVLGLIILAALVLFHRPKGQSQPNHARWRQKRREPSLGDPKADDRKNTQRDSGNDDQAAEDEPQFSFSAFSEAENAADHKIDGKTEAAAKPDGPRQSAGKMVEPDKIITLYVRRRDNRRIAGSDLLDAAVKAGLTFGEMSIFHRRQEGADKPVFSMANLTPPGHFDSSAWNVFDTPGVALFATLPGPVSALDAWDAMLATGRRIAELLDADLLDEARCELTRQRIAQMREELREYDRVHGFGNG